MSYEKLVKIYKASGCENIFPIKYVSDLHEYIEWSLKRGKRSLSPFKFARIAELSLEESVTFFMYFSKEEGIFELERFVECPSTSCDARIYLDDEFHLYKQLLCEECSEYHSVEIISKYIKVYFRLKDDFTKCESVCSKSKKSDDPNSMHDILRGMSEGLKPNSPSSLSLTERLLEEGDDEPVGLDTILQINQTAEEPILEYDWLLSMMKRTHS